MWKKNKKEYIGLNNSKEKNKLHVEVVAVKKEALNKFSLLCSSLGKKDFM